MSFSDQLKSQASALQDQQCSQSQNFEASSAQTKAACQKVWCYLPELSRQLNMSETARLTPG